VIRAGAQEGVTLVEMVIGMTAIAIAVTGTLIVVNRTTVASAEPLIERQAASVAEGYLEEILLRAFFDPDLGSGGGACPAPEPSRQLFDNVCDYSGLDDRPPQDQEGGAIAELAAYRVRVSVDQAATLGDLSGSADVLRVDVRVTHTNLVDFVLSGYRARY
jgi:MSHA pilin protein MshD